MAAPRKSQVSINLNCYSIRFRKKGDKSEFLTYGQMFGKLTFKEFIQKFITTIDVECFANEAKDRILSLESKLTFTETIFSGVVKKGRSSHETYVQELNDTVPVTVNTIRADQFNSSPFYFLISLPSRDEKYLIFMAQSYKQFGFKELFEDAFIKFFKKNYGDNHVCEFGVLSIASLFKKYVQEGNIRKLRLRKHDLVPQLEDIVQDVDRAPGDYEVELSVRLKRKKKGFLSGLQKIDFDKSSFVEIFQTDFSYDEVLVDVSVGDRKRVLNFADPDSFAASYDVTKEAALDTRTRHPTFTTLDIEAKNILVSEIIPNIK